MEHDVFDADDREQRLNAVIATWLQAVESGRPPARSAFVLQHTEFAGDLEEFFAGCDVVREFAGRLDSSGRRGHSASLPPRRRTQQPGVAVGGGASEGMTGDLHDRREFRRADGFEDAAVPRVAIDADTPSGGRAETVTVSPAASRRAFGPYDLLEELGRGGMGVVYRAHDTRLKREVALKMLRDARISSPIEVLRFQNEVQAVARLDHAGIVPIYEVGEHEGQSYFTMKLIDGGRLSQHVSRFENDPRAAAAIVAEISDAVHHAHQRGILHRDLKPSNLLLDGEGQPHVTDFGLARAVEGANELTWTGEMVGTPPYMAPEQAAGRREAATVATDVYGLGAVLYVLLSGEPPFSGETALATLRLVVQFDPQPPRSRNPRVERDLEVICLKALEKEPERRYASAAELAEDLRRYLAGTPIRARKTPWLERAWRWMRRNPAGTALLATILLAGSAGLAGLVVHSRKLSNVNARLTSSLVDAQRARTAAEAARHLADENERHAEELLYAATIRLAAKARDERDPRQMIEVLNRVRPESGGPDLRGFEWYYLWQQATADAIEVAASPEPLYDVAYSPDGRLVACCGKDTVVRIYDADRYAPVLSFATGQIETNGVAFSPDGQLLATTGDDGTVRLWDISEKGTGSRPKSQTVTVARSISTGQLNSEPESPSAPVPFSAAMTLPELLRIAAHPGKAFQVVFSRDGSTLYTCGDDPAIRIWNAANGQPLGTLERHTVDVEAITLSPDGRLLASASRDRSAIVWNLKTRSVHRRFETVENADSVAFSPDAALLAVGLVNARVKLWHLETGEELDGPVNRDGFSAVAFARDGQGLVAAGRAGNLGFWPLRTRDETGLADVADSGPEPLQPSDLMHTEPRPRLWAAHADRVYAIAFSPRTATIASVGNDGWLKFWEYAPAPTRWKLPRDDESSAVFAPIPGTTQVAVVERHQLRIYDSLTGRDSGDLRPPGFRWDEVAVSPEGRCLAGLTKTALVVLFDLTTGRERRRVQLGDGVDSGGHVVFSPDSRRLAVRLAKDPEPVRLLDPTTGEIVGTFATRGTMAAPAFSTDGRRLALTSLSDVLVYDLETGRRLHKLSGHRASIYAITFSSDDRWLATAGEDRTVRLWDAARGTLRSAMVGHRAPVWSLASSPDGRSLLAGDEAGALKVWHVATGQELGDLERVPAGIFRLSVSPNGQRVSWQSAVAIHFCTIPGMPAVE